VTFPTYEIYALKYAGPFSRPASMVHWFQDLDKTIQINYYFFVISGSDRVILVDCGCRPKLAEERDLIGYVNPVDALRKINIDADQIKHLIVSHIHFDHVGGIELFPEATIFIQKNEFDFWIKDPMAKRAPFLQVTDPVVNDYLEGLEGDRRLRLVQGDEEILPGIQLLLCPGHTVGLQTVVVNTEKGKAVIGSDSAHTFSSYRTDIPSAIITDMISWIRSYDKIRAEASAIDLIFPGHDLTLLDNYPEVAEDVSKLV
jgi:glyoxylase-like metal-dependent hydrolase (beta-lactamase superfamily II)